ncbi:MAG TPA: metallophosphoesterase [Alcanivoracaceae bacterium]|nr:metallophosphoesterase [Alcanivoracaceae bacterium]
MPRPSPTSITYDVIGDVHGYYDKLVQLLEVLGYTKEQGVWQQPGHKAVFVGDLIDKGPEPAEVLELVKAMVNNNVAMMVIGNHELNWIQAAAPYLRDLERFIGVTNRHGCRRKITAAYRYQPDRVADLLEWLSEQPLYIEHEDIRVVHACWHKESIELLKRSGINNMSRRAILSYRELYSDRYLAIDRIVSGCLHEFPEHRQHKRYRSVRKRRQWWPGDTVKIHPKEGVLPKVHQASACMDGPPIFFGHYALTGTPTIAGENIVCVDFSVAYDGPLVAYRYVPGQPIDNQHFIMV